MSPAGAPRHLDLITPTLASPPAWGPLKEIEVEVVRDMGWGLASCCHPGRLPRHPRESGVPISGLFTWGQGHGVSWDLGPRLTTLGRDQHQRRVLCPHALDLF